MFELVAETGCGYVLMHIEGPPRVDRPLREYGDVVDHLRAWFEGRVELARELGVAEEQIAIDPGLDFDLSPEQDLEILRRLGELRALGLPLYVSLSRKDFIGAVLAGSWEERLPAGEREWGTVAAVTLAVREGADVLRIHDRSSLQAMRVAAEIGEPGLMARGGSLLASELGRRDRPRAAGRADRRRELRRGAPLAAGAAAGRARPGLAEALGRVGIDSLYTHQLAPSRPPPTPNLVITSGTASGKSLAFNLPVLNGIAARPKDRALYLYPTKALAQDQARKLAQLRPPSLREAIYDGDTPREERPAIRRRNNLVLTNPDMLHVGVLPEPQELGRLPRQPRAGSSSTRPTPTAASSAPTSPTSCGGCGGWPAPTAPSRASCSPRRRSPTRSSWPSGWSGRRSS